MPPIFLPDLRLNVEVTGPPGGPCLVLIHALGTQLSIWNDLIPLLPPGLRLLRLDLRGHGQSDAPQGPYAMGALIRDVERLMDHFAMTEAVVLGLSIGGLIAQGLAVKRLDLVRGMILSNTAMRMERPEQWQARIDAVRAGGLRAIHDATMERWLGRKWKENPSLARLSEIFLATSPEGWMGCAAAIAGTDFYETTASLTLPTLAVAAANDGVTPPDLVRETAALIRGHRFALIRGAGHLPMVEKPAEYAALLTQFLTEIGHV